MRSLEKLIGIDLDDAAGFIDYLAIGSNRGDDINVTDTENLLELLHWPRYQDG